MAENENGQEKKHAPSERKWEDAAESGQLPRSADLQAGVVLLAGGAAMAFGASWMHQVLVSHWVDTWSGLDGTLARDQAVTLVTGGLQAALLAAAVPLGAALIAGTVVGFLQTGGQMAPKALEPKWERLDPIAGFQNQILSWQPFVELGKGSAKLIALGAAIAYGLRDRMDLIPRLATMSAQQQLGEMGDLAWTALVSAIPMIVVLAIVDYGWTYWRQYQNLMLTDQDLRDENKQTEGDPQMKARRRARQRQIAMNSMISAVREADVVVTNPTHYAVALRYRKGVDAAPVVLAKGVDHVALKMRAEALRHDVPQIENRPLARALHARVKVGRAVPEELYGPVAKVLAVVYRRRAAARARRARA